MAPDPKASQGGWINVYPAERDCPLSLSVGIVATTSQVYRTRKEADTAAAPKRMACVPIFWYEE